MSLASPIVLAPKNSTPASVWTTQKNHGLPPKAPWLQQKPVAETAGELPPLPLPNAQLVVPHSIPVLVSGPATDTTVPDSENAAPKETDDALCARLAAQPNDQLNSREQELRATVLEIEAFIGEEAPTQSQLVAACNALKAMAGDNNHKLKSLPDTCSGDWVRFLSISIEKFLKHLSSLETNQFPWDEMTMRQFAQMCYGLKACY